MSSEHPNKDEIMSSEHSNKDDVATPTANKNAFFAYATPTTKNDNNRTVVCTNQRNGIVEVESHWIENPKVTDRAEETPIKLGGAYIEFNPEDDSILQRLEAIGGDTQKPSKNLKKKIIEVKNELKQLSAVETWFESAQSEQMMLRKAGKLMGKYSEADQNIIDARECLAESEPELEYLKKKIKTLQARKAELELKVQKNNDILVGSEDLQLQICKKLLQLLYLKYRDLSGERILEKLAYPREVRLNAGFFKIGNMSGENDPSALWSVNDRIQPKEALRRILYRLKNLGLEKNEDYKGGKIVMDNSQSKFDLVCQIAELFQIGFQCVKNAEGEIVDVRDDERTEKRELTPTSTRSAKKRRVGSPDVPTLQEFKDWGLVDEQGNFIVKNVQELSPQSK